MLRLVFGLCLMGCQLVATGWAEAGEKTLEQWFAQKYEEYLQFSPMTLTRLGRKERYSEINDMSEAAEQKRLNWFVSSLEELKTQYPYDSLTFEQQTSYDVFAQQAEFAQLSYDYRYHRFIFHQMEGIHVNLPNFLINNHRVDSAADMDAYIARVGGIARAIEQLLEKAKQNAQKGVRPPRFSYQEVIQHCRNLLSGKPFEDSQVDSALFADALQKIAALEEASVINEAQSQAFRGRIKTALLTEFAPAYESLISWLIADMDNTLQLAKGVGALHDGDDYYAATLKMQNTTTMTAEQIHQLGLQEIARIRKQMQNIMAQVGFEGTLKEFFALVKNNKADRRFFYEDNEQGRAAYLQDSRDYLTAMKQRLPDYFGILPKADLIVKRVEPFREQDGMAQHYYAGTPDGGRPGTYYAHLSDMTAMPIIEMEAIAYHEGNPGHHMQISIAQELQNIPEFRTQASFTGFIEGWAVYSEILSKEMGAFQNPYSDFGRLVLELWRAIRLVADTGIHAKGWTEQQTFEFFRDNSPRSETSIRAEVRRYFVWPGQATAYMIGRIKILQLRELAQQELGDKFDIRAFHDQVLGGGALPLSILEKRIHHWIAAVQRGA